MSHRELDQGLESELGGKLIYSDCLCLDSLPAA
jgi:hypothetical protein